MKKKIIFRNFFVGILMLCCLACIMQPQPVSLPQPVLPVIEEFSGNMSRSTYPPCELKWRVRGANSIYIDKGIDKVDSAGTKNIYPKIDTIFTLTASNEAGSVSKPTAIFAHRYCAGLPTMEGYSQYVDDINDIGLVYPSSWVIEKKHFSEPEAQPSGVLLSNGMPDSDYAFYNFVIESKELSFDKRAYANKYKEERLTRGYHLIYDKTMHIGGDERAIMQMYNRISDNQSYEHGAIFRFLDLSNEFWLETYEWPHDKTEYNIPNCFSYCPYSKSFK